MWRNATYVDEAGVDVIGTVHGSNWLQKNARRFVCNCTASTLHEWVEFNAHPTQYRSFRRRSQRFIHYYYYGSIVSIVVNFSCHSNHRYLESLHCWPCPANRKTCRINHWQTREAIFLFQQLSIAPPSPQGEMRWPSSTPLTPIRSLLSTMFKACSFVIVGEK